MKKTVYEEEDGLCCIFFLVNITQVAYAGVLAMAKKSMLEFGVEVIEFSFMRFFTIFVIVQLMIFCYDKSPFISVKNELKRLLVIRSVLSAVGFMLISLSSIMLPLTIVMVLISSLPFFNALFSKLISPHPESLTLFHVYCAVGWAIGVVLILREIPV